MLCRKKKKKWLGNIVLIGYTMSMGMSIILYYVFAIAFINGGTVQVFINKFNEGWLEYFLFPVVLWFIVMGWFLYLKKPQTI